MKRRGVAPLFAQGAQKGTPPAPFPLLQPDSRNNRSPESNAQPPPISPTSLVWAPLHAQQLPHLPPAPTQTRESHANEHTWTLPAVCIRGAERYVLTSPPFVPSALTPPLIAAPPPLCTRPLPFPPPVCDVHRGLLPIPHTPEEGGCAAKLCSHTHPLSSCTALPCVPPLPLICPHTPRPCPHVRHSPHTLSRG